MLDEPKICTVFVMRAVNKPSPVLSVLPFMAKKQGLFQSESKLGLS